MYSGSGFLIGQLASKLWKKFKADKSRDKCQPQDFVKRALVLTTNQSKHGSQKRMDAFSKVQFNFLPFFPSFPFFFDRE